MAWSPVTWAYKDLVTSAKLAQMQENTRTHDHRPDGTQGDPTSIVSGPSFGAASATIAAAANATMATITIPVLKRGSTLWIQLSCLPQAAFQRIDFRLSPVDARIASAQFTAAPGTINHTFLGGPAIGNAEMFTVGFPVAAGAATGTAMAALINPQAASILEARLLWWVDS